MCDNVSERCEIQYEGKKKIPHFKATKGEIMWEWVNEIQDATINIMTLSL